MAGLVKENTLLCVAHGTGRPGQAGHQDIHQAAETHTRGEVDHRSVKWLAPETRRQYLQRLRELLHASPGTQRLMLTWEAIRMLSGDGAAVGSYTVSYAILSRLSGEQVWGRSINQE